MKLDAIFDLWEQDSVVDRANLDTESLAIGKLHSKYHRIYTNERLVQKKLELDLKSLRLEKQEFLTQGPSKETAAKGWVLPPIGRIVKSEVGHYLDADKEIIEHTLKIALQEEKIRLLESIIQVLMRRSYTIKNAIDFAKFESGM